jgi:hypothetical protein
VETTMQPSFNELHDLERQFETKPGPRYRIFHFQLKEINDNLGILFWVLLITGFLPILLLALILWRIW